MVVSVDVGVVPVCFGDWLPLEVAVVFGVAALVALGSFLSSVFVCEGCVFVSQLGVSSTPRTLISTIDVETMRGHTIGIDHSVVERSSAESTAIFEGRTAGTLSVIPPRTMLEIHWSAYKSYGRRATKSSIPVLSPGQH